MKFYIIASGSKGNATLLEHDNRVLLIDMGITLSRLKDELDNIGRKMDNIEAVLFTHEHSDHASGARFFDDKKIYASEGTLYMRSVNFITPYEKINLIGLDITPLATSHDAFSPLGFIFEHKDEKLVYMTDTGFISEKNIEVMKNADYYIIEANHNIKMLLKTNRPIELKQRILSDVGHLSNEDSAMYMSELIGAKTKEIVLAHLSEEANDQETALAAYTRVLKRRMVDIRPINIHCAHQWDMAKEGKPMKIKIIAVGNIKEDYWRVALEEYQNRLSLYTKIEIIEIKDEPAPAHLSKILQEKVKLKEGTKILSKIKDKDLVVAVDLDGPQRTSETFAKFLNSLFERGNSEIVFVIGGSLGLSPEIKARADEVLTLSKLTFTHQMTRVILLEQIYRGFKINRNETYHK